MSSQCDLCKSGAINLETRVGDGGLLLPTGRLLCTATDPQPTKPFARLGVKDHLVSDVDTIYVFVAEPTTFSECRHLRMQRRPKKGPLVSAQSCCSVDRSGHQNGACSEDPKTSVGNRSIARAWQLNFRPIRHRAHLRVGAVKTSAGSESLKKLKKLWNGPRGLTLNTGLTNGCSTAVSRWTVQTREVH